MYISDLTDTIEIPNEPGATATIRKLTRGQKREARHQRSVRAISNVRDLGGPALLREFEEARNKIREEGDEDKATAAVDPLNGLDEDTVLTCGLVALDPKQYDTLAEAVDRLDEDTALHIAKAIVAFSSPDPVAEKNG